MKNCIEFYAKREDKKPCFPGFCYCGSECPGPEQRYGKTVPGTTETEKEAKK